jgi:hypothetical protein
MTSTSSRMQVDTINTRNRGTRWNDRATLAYSDRGSAALGASGLEDCAAQQRREAVVAVGVAALRVRERLHRQAWPHG